MSSPSVEQYYDDPLGFVYDAYPWGEGDLAGFDGPDANQIEFLTALGKEVRERKFRRAHACCAGAYGRDLGPRHRKVGARRVDRELDHVGQALVSRHCDRRHCDAARGADLVRDCSRLDAALSITKDWWDIQTAGIPSSEALCGPTQVAGELEAWSRRRARKRTHSLSPTMRRRR